MEAQPNHEAETVMKVFVNAMLCMGFPRHIFTDRGTQFTSQLATGLAKTFGMTRVYTSKFNLQSDGQTENLNRTVLNMLAKSTESPTPDNWDKYLPFCQFAYNSMPHAVTGISPHWLLFGRDSNIPSSSILDALPSPNVCDRDMCLEKVNDRLQHGWSSARYITVKQQERACKYEHETKHQFDLHEGDWVF